MEYEKVAATWWSWSFKILLPVHEGQFSRSGGGVFSWGPTRKQKGCVCLLDSIPFYQRKTKSKNCVSEYDGLAKHKRWKCFAVTCPNVKTNGFCRLTHGFPVVFKCFRQSVANVANIKIHPKRSTWKSRFDLAVFFQKKKWTPSKSLHQLLGPCNLKT